ncbi:DUF6270 domain-containing protein [Bacillus cereus]|uniref:DUF6270 domain-containing protein n=1 Tax=Bacillus cereus group TaxID=86661 RepID=UPI0029E83627|nr:DUF6270 domain-containing protein [Bacillus cereus]MDA2318261.1 DUF6270 domain-containing protein [Bacillus cereus]MDA2503327.1 DUF6270 domain-containing protein [Bacillus cereus]
MAFPGEKTFQSTRPVKYVFQKADKPCNHLIIVFSGFHGREIEGMPPVYNYVKTLDECQCNKLFILDDYDGKVSYYIGKNRDYALEAAVISLITYIANENMVPMGNIITCGSSKGGYAALYYAIKYSFGAAISGGPQTLMGDYLFNLSSFTRGIIEFIAGDCSKESVEFLNGLLYQPLEQKNVFPEINIQVGKGDHHYPNHILPFVEKLGEEEIPYNLEVADYEKHGEVAQYFPKYMLKNIERIINSKDQLRYKREEKITPSVAILGSCVTRDAFTFDKEKRVELPYYQARTSLLSIMTKPYEVQDVDLSNLSSDFQKRLVKDDMMKNFFGKISAKPSEYLILDFIDERFDMVKIGESYITRSFEFINSKLESKLEDFEVVQKRMVLEQWEQACDTFAKEIIKAYGQSKIILHRAYCKDEYLDKEGIIRRFNPDILERNKVLNELLSHLYNYIQQVLPDMKIIDLSDEKHYAWEGHTWGLSAFHYEDKYYIDFLKNLEGIISK